MPGKQARVLVIDDERAVGAVLRRVLEREHEVTVVEDARRGLELLRAGHRYDVIFCDLMMPYMTGAELHDELSRALPDVVETMVFMTGGAVTPATRAFLDSVPNPRLEKPFAAQNVLALVRSAVR